MQNTPVQEMSEMKKTPQQKREDAFCHCFGFAALAAAAAAFSVQYSDTAALILGGTTLCCMGAGVGVAVYDCGVHLARRAVRAAARVDRERD